MSKFCNLDDFKFKIESLGHDRIELYDYHTGSLAYQLVGEKEDKPKIVIDLMTEYIKRFGGQYKAQTRPDKSSNQTKVVTLVEYRIAGEEKEVKPSGGSQQGSMSVEQMVDAKMKAYHTEQTNLLLKEQIKYYESSEHKLEKIFTAAATSIKVALGGSQEVPMNGAAAGETITEPVQGAAKNNVVIPAEDIRTAFAELTQMFGGVENIVGITNHLKKNPHLADLLMRQI